MLLVVAEKRSVGAEVGPGFVVGGPGRHGSAGENKDLSLCSVTKINPSLQVPGRQETPGFVNLAQFSPASFENLTTEFGEQTLAKVISIFIKTSS
jgi:hypothetical protein